MVFGSEISRQRPAFTQKAELNSPTESIWESDIPDIKRMSTARGLAVLMDITIAPKPNVFLSGAEADNARRSMALQLSALQREGKLTDVTVRLLDGKSAVVHRLILACHCNLLDKFMGENPSELVLSEISAPTFDAFLRFAYQGILDTMEREGLGILAKLLGAVTLERALEDHRSRF